MDQLFFVTEPDGLPPGVAAQLAANDFQGHPGQVQRLTQGYGSTHIYVGATGGTLGFWTGAKACQAARGLETIHVQNADVLTETQVQDFVLSWSFDSYRFERFKAKARPCVCVGLTANARTQALAEGMALARTLINTPANLMTPAGLQAAAETLARDHAAQIEVIDGADLRAGFPLIDAVGKAAGPGDMAPRLIDLRWGHEGPRLTLVGKGITFDTGGLNLKPGGSMRLMKKDMGGAAHALGLAATIMALAMPLRLRVLIPAAENALGAGAFRPGDVIAARSGSHVEIDNTDAEGRLVLADALTYAGEAEEAADLTISLATLTGAARVALGPHIAPYLTNRTDLTWQLLAASHAEADPLWPLPLFQPYEAYLKSDVADLVNAGPGRFAGAITAALFLARFAGDRPWAHFDLYGWNPEAKPGRPRGGAAQGLMSLLTFLESWAHD